MNKVLKIFFQVCVAEVICVFLDWILYITYRRTPLFWIVFIILLLYINCLSSYIRKKWKIKLWMACMLGFFAVWIGLLFLFLVRNMAC